MRKTKRIILVGKAASGKDYFRNHMNDRGYDIEVSYTTRPMRTGEVPGYTYHYVSEHEFQNMRDGGNMFEAVPFNGKWYGTHRENWEKCDVFIFTPSGIRQIPEEDRKDCFIVYFDMPYDIRLARLQERSDWDSAERRIAADEKDFESFVDFDMRVTDPGYDSFSLEQQILKAIQNVEV